MNKTAAACERLFALMAREPSKVRRPDHDEVYRMMCEQHYGVMAHETPLSGSLLDAAPVPPPLHPQTSQTDSAVL